jgi:hypothetical protein
MHFEENTNMETNIVYTVYNIDEYKEIYKLQTNADRACMLKCNTKATQTQKGMQHKRACMLKHIYMHFCCNLQYPNSNIEPY